MKPGGNWMNVASIDEDGEHYTADTAEQANARMHWNPAFLVACYKWGGDYQK